MVHALPQFTPAQLIESGRRAEAEGRLDLAVQFYRHLTEHFAEAVEAAEAHGALGRIGTVRPGQHPRSQRGLRARPGARRDHYRIGRALTVLFSAFGWLVALTGPCAVLAYALVGGESAAPASGGPVPLAGIAGGLFLVGFGIVLGARLARAQFDQANAMRELLALEHAKLGLE
jgi:hypothetical protein